MSHEENLPAPAKPVDIPLAAVESQGLEAAGYDLASQTFRVRFRNSRKAYDYSPVGPDVAQGFFECPTSKFKYFQQHIQTQPYTLVPEPAKQEEPAKK